MTDDEHIERLKRHEPVTKRDLADESFVSEAYQVADDSDDYGANPLGVQMLIQDVLDCAGNIFIYEISTALNYHGVASAPHHSREFENRLHRWGRKSTTTTST
jgi:hypothetical protein